MLCPPAPAGRARGRRGGHGRREESRRAARGGTTCDRRRAWADWLRGAAPGSRPDHSGRGPGIGREWGLRRGHAETGTKSTLGRVLKMNMLADQGAPDVGSPLESLDEEAGASASGAIRDPGASGTGIRGTSLEGGKQARRGPCPRRRCAIWPDLRAGRGWVLRAGGIPSGGG